MNISSPFNFRNDSQSQSLSSEIKRRKGSVHNIAKIFAHFSLALTCKKIYVFSHPVSRHTWLCFPYFHLRYVYLIFSRRHNILTRSLLPVFATRNAHISFLVQKVNTLSLPRKPRGKEVMLIRLCGYHQFIVRDGNFPAEVITRCRGIMCRCSDLVEVDSRKFVMCRMS